MRTFASNTVEPKALGHALLHLLVVLYSIASATSLVNGTHLSLLLTPFMSASLAQFITLTVVVALGAMLLLGIKRRAAALLLAVLVLWASYFAILGPAASTPNGSHWRDMVLIGALLLIYSDTKNQYQNDFGFFLKLGNAYSDGTSKQSQPSQFKRNASPDMNVRRVSQTLFHEDLDHLSTR